jgi:hypothetical protein
MGVHRAAERTVGVLSRLELPEVTKTQTANPLTTLDASQAE